ncbi:hypothetical protein SIID45300_01744 [Candidatus Magnetaquicoccaceae bacterium FCR-1]|uniref:Phage tail tape measure protein domain-containing protein n=1 Tax=Candidatus Magnetaquiglobus chichijimensis TaxID=3141448 RepID=A0ABQ0C960_9PROT
MSSNELDVALVIRGQNETGPMFGSLSDALKAAMAALVAFGAASVAMAATAAKEFAEFEQGLLNVQAASEGTRRDFEQFKKAALEASAASKFNPKETVGALYDLSSAGLKSSEAIKALAPVMTLASASNASLARSSENVVQVMGMFGLGAEKAGAIADTMTAAIQGSTMDADRLAVAFRNSGATANAMGQSFETTTAVLAVLTNSFMSGEASGTGLKSLFGELNQKSSALGINMRDLSGKMKPLPEIVEDLARAGWTADKAVSEFGADAGPALAVLLTQGADAIRDMERKVQSNGQAAKAAAIQNSGLKGALSELSSAYDVLKLKMGEAVAPGEQLAARQLAWFLQLPGVVRAAEGLGSAVGSMGQYVVPILYSIGEAGYWVYGKLQEFGNTPGIQKLGYILGWLWGVASMAFNAITEEAGKTGGIFNSVVHAVGGVVAEIGGFFAEMIAGAVGWETSSYDLVKGSVSAYRIIRDAVLDMWDGARGVFGAFKETLNANGVTARSTGEVIGAAFRWILQMAGELWKGGEKALGGLGQAAEKNGITVRSVTQKIVDAVKWVIAAFKGDNAQVNGWVASIGSAFSEVSGFAGTLWEGIKGGAKLVWESIKQTFGMMKQEFLGVTASADTISLEQLITQLKNVKAEDIASWIKKQFDDFIATIKETYKEWSEKAKAFKEGYEQIKQTLSDVGEWIASLDPLLTVLKWLAIAAGFFVVAFVTGLNGVIKTGFVLAEKIGEAFGKIKAYFKTLAPAFEDVKKGLSGIADGIVGIFNSMYDKVAGVVQSIVNAWNRVTGGGGATVGAGGGASGVADDGWRDPFGGTDPFFRTPAFSGGDMPVQGYATGTTYIPRDGLYRLHQGEQVVSNSSTTTFGNISLNLGGNAPPISQAEWRRIVRTIIAPELVLMGRAG